MQEAGEILSNMNHPAGDCPLCLYPLMGEDKVGSDLPFMKLMSCYHCFHRLTKLYNIPSNLLYLVCSLYFFTSPFSDCIMRWWEWLQHGDTNPKEPNTGGADIIIFFEPFPYFEYIS